MQILCTLNFGNLSISGNLILFLEEEQSLTFVVGLLYVPAQCSACHNRVGQILIIYLSVSKLRHKGSQQVAQTQIKEAGFKPRSPALVLPPFSSASLL